jgi:membrane peptidoglycan carboxypeptidase
MTSNKGSSRNRRSKNTITTKSGNTLKINRSLSDRAKARKADRAAAKALYLSTLPKDRIKRILFRLHPKRVVRYWFSREGGIMALKIIGVSIICGFFLTIGLFAYFRKDLPKIKDLSGGNLGGNTVYYDSTGKTVLWQDYNSVKRVPVAGDQISKYMKQATVAIEDKDFYKHGAFDVRGIMRAAYHDVTGATGAVQGGSTITQQLVKLNENWTNNRTITRKVKELILATELEREYSKDDILTGYLNTAPYGGVEYGVETAAKDYFQTSAKDLTLAQASMLAAIPQSPSYYSPYASSKYNSSITDDTFNQGALVGRQQYILNQMVKQGYITKQQASDAQKVDVLAQVHEQTPKYKDIKAPYFVLAAKQELEQTYGSTTIQRGGWKVITTLNMDLQTKAEALAQANIPNINRAGADEEAMVGEDVQTGQIVSLVGGTDFNNTDHGQNNYAAGILIPPGSSFKPYDYATLINNNNNVGAGSVLYDSKTPLPGYSGSCQFKPAQGIACPAGTEPFLYDYDYLFPGPITLRYALGGSRNIPAVKAMLSAVPNDKSNGRTDSVNKVIDTASALMANKYDQAHHLKSYNCYADEALTQVSQCHGAAAIGDGAYLHLDDHVNGIASLARLGQAIPRTYILKITDAADKNVYQWKQPKPTQAIKADAAYILDDMASDPKASYLNGSCTDTNCTNTYGGKYHRYNGWKFAIKTGTTNDGHDGLMESWSTKYAMVVWVGNHTRQVTLHNFMENLTEPMIKPWMQYAHQNVTAANWVQPKTVKSAPAFVVRNHIHYGDVEPSPTNDLFPGWYVGGGQAKKSSSQTMDKVSNKVATSCTPPLAKDIQSNANVASWNADIFSGGAANIGTGSSSNSKSTTSTPTDDVHNCNDSPPTVTLTAPSNCDSSCTITATVTQGTHPLSDIQYPQFPGTIVFTLGGQTIHSQNISDSPSTISFTYTPTSNGSDTVTATVTDSVLYQGTASQAMSYNIPVPKSLTLSLGDHSGITQKLIWNDLGPGTSYQLCWSSSNGGVGGGCTNTSSTFYTITGLTPTKSYSAKVSAGGIDSNSQPWTQ